MGGLTWSNMLPGAPHHLTTSCHSETPEICLDVSGLARLPPDQRGHIGCWGGCSALCIHVAAGFSHDQTVFVFRDNFIISLPFQIFDDNQLQAQSTNGVVTRMDVRAVLCGVRGNP